MRTLGNIIKSRSDNRIYKAIELPNKLECLIISDCDAEKASTALSVGVGSFQDPISAQGLAHYLEHMLFMGTTKYPNENEYSQYLSKNSGMSNAYTSQEETNYFFEVANPALKGALDRFAQFFISPLMAESSSEKQLNAVHSQHTKNIYQDNWRYFQLLKHSSKKGSAFNKFSTGDKSTLSNSQLRPMLLDFYDRHYSSNLMKLVVYSKQNVDKISELVSQLFTAIPNKNLSKYKLNQPPFDTSNLKNIYKIVPIQNKMTITYMWILPNQQQHYRNSPGSYISHLIGHEGPGSLLSLLIKEGLAYQLSSDSSDQYHTYTQFMIKIVLTEKGLQNHHLVTQYLMYYLEMLKNKGPQEWYFKQIQKINKIKFDYMDKTHSMNFVSGLAKRMQTTPINQTMIKSYLMEQWKPELISNYLNGLNLDNLRISITAPQFEKEAKLTQPIYGTKFAVESIQKILPKQCSVNFPPQNTFFPQDFSLINSQQQYPTEIYSSDRVQVFYKPDHRFKLPKGILKIRLCFKNLKSPKQQVTKSIYLKMLLNYLKEIQYMAATASIKTDLETNPFSITIQISGFNDSLSKFTDQYLDKIFNFIPQNIQNFKDVKDKKIRDYANFFKGNPYTQGFQYHNCALKQGVECEPQQKTMEVQKITFQDVLQFNKSWKQNIFAEIYIGGNFSQQLAKQIGKSIEGQIAKFSKPLPVSQISSIRAINLIQNQIWAIHKFSTNQKQLNSCFICHFQYEHFGIRPKVLQDLCLQIIKQPTFDYLRTKQQLGYIVTCFPDQNRGILGLSFLVQSNIKSSHELQVYVDNLINNILSPKINNMSSQQFDVYKKSLIIAKSQKPKTLVQQTSRFWDQISKHSYEFKRRQLEIQTIPQITIQEIRLFFMKMFLLNPRRFETHVISPATKELTIKLAEQRAKQGKLRLAPSIDWFKKRMPLYPDFYAHL